MGRKDTANGISYAPFLYIKSKSSHGNQFIPVQGTFRLIKFYDAFISQKSGGKPQKTMTYEYGKMDDLDFPWKLIK